MTPKHRWAGAALFGALGIALVLLLWLRETSATESVAHVGQLPFADFRFRPRHTDRVLGWLSALAGAGLLAFGLLRRARFAQHRAVSPLARLGLVLVLLSSGAAWLYGARGVAQTQYIKAWDSFHYLLGPKYFDEVGYFGLYDCVAAADAETVNRLRNSKVRDLQNYDRRLHARQAAKRGRCHERFSPERWEEFKQDYLFYARLSPGILTKVVRDHGYNGTPTHAFLAGAIANGFELDYRSAMAATLIDTLSLLAMFWALSIAVGWELAALTAILFFTAFTDRGYFILGSFVRYQWMVFSGLGLAALARRRHATAGALLATAGMLNVFPVLFFVGIAARAAWQLVLTRSFGIEHRRLIAGAIAASLVLAALGISHADGIGNYESFLHNMEQHAGLVTRSRVGLQYTLAYRGEIDADRYSTNVTRAEIHRTRPHYYAIAAVLLLVFVGTARRIDDMQASVLGGVASFFYLFGTVEYYYGIFSLILLVWHRAPVRAPTALLLALPFVLNSLVYWVYHETGVLGIANNSAMSFAILTVLVVYHFALLGRELPERWDTWVRRGSQALALSTGAVVVGLTLFWMPPFSVARATGPVLAFGGDVNLGRRQQAWSARDGYADALENVEELRTAELAVANLECVVASRGERRIDKQERASYYFRARPETLAVLGEAGIDVVSTANNHSLDYGPEALRQQESLIDQMGIGSVGAGKDRDAACAPIFRWSGDVALALFAFDSTQASFAAGTNKPGTCHFPLGAADELRAYYEPRIARARERAHVVIVLPHWGPNRRTTPTRREIDMGHALIKAGADAVLGTSAHMVQGVEIYRGRPIVHDAGDLLFDYTNDEEEGALFSLVLSKDGVRQLQVTPLERRPGKTLVARGRRARRQLRDLWLRSAELGTSLVIQDERAFVDLDPDTNRTPPTKDVPPNPPAGLAPSPEPAPPLECVASVVPADAAIDPVQLGPLTLVGFRTLDQRIDRSQDVWFESYFTVPARVDQSFWIRLEGIPDHRAAERWRADYEPCDFQWPTDRWHPGVIYRDLYGVRPPGAVESGTLSFDVAVLEDRRPIARHRGAARVEVALDSQ